MKFKSARRPIATLSLGLLAATLLGTPDAAHAAKIVMPEGTPITLRLEQALGSEISHKGDTFDLTVADDVKIDGHTVIRAGERASGTVSVAQSRGRLARQGRLGIELGSIQIKGQVIELRATREADATPQPRARRLLSRIAAPVKRVARNVASATDRELVTGSAAETLKATDGKVSEVAGRMLGTNDPLANVELGSSGRAVSLVNRGVRGLERAGTGYVVSILSGPTGLLKKGSSVEIPAGTTINAVIVADVTL